MSVSERLLGLINKRKDVRYVTKYELATIFEALIDIKPETRALVKEELSVSVPELRAKVWRLINEGGDANNGD